MRHDDRQFLNFDIGCFALLRISTTSKDLEVVRDQQRILI